MLVSVIPLLKTFQSLPLYHRIQSTLYSMAFKHLRVVGPATSPASSLANDRHTGFLAAPHTTKHTPYHTFASTLPFAGTTCPSDLHMVTPLLGPSLCTKHIWSERAFSWPLYSQYHPTTLHHFLPLYAAF